MTRLTSSYQDKSTIHAKEEIQEGYHSSYSTNSIKKTKIKAQEREGFPRRVQILAKYFSQWEIYVMK